jgi:hypothetical protein
MTRTGCDRMLTLELPLRLVRGRARALIAYDVWIRFDVGAGLRRPPAVDRR